MLGNIVNVLMPGRDHLQSPGQKPPNPTELQAGLVLSDELEEWCPWRLGSRLTVSIPDKKSH